VSRDDPNSALKMPLDGPRDDGLGFGADVLGCFENATLNVAADGDNCWHAEFALDDGEFHTDGKVVVYDQAKFRGEIHKAEGRFLGLRSLRHYLLRLTVSC
jgi:hypothetical protein